MGVGDGGGGGGCWRGVWQEGEWGKEGVGVEVSASAGECEFRRVRVQVRQRIHNKPETFP